MIIKSFPDYTIDEGGVIRNKKGKVISPYKDQLGYAQIVLRKNKKRHYVRVHRLMAEAFLHPTQDRPFVNHIDGNKLNNHLENLEVCSNKENVQHAYDTGLYKDRRECHPIAVYDGVVEKTYRSIRETSRELGINRKRITAILKGEVPNTTYFEFKYL